MDEGKRQIDAARELSITSGTVRYIWNKYLDTSSTDDRPRSGRPLKTTEKERRLIVRQCKRNPFASSNEINNLINSEKNVSNRTIRRILRKSNLFPFQAAFKPNLSKVNIRKRIGFCKAYMKWTIDQWKTVIFSDECRIIRFSKSRRIVYRPLSTRYKKRYTIKTVKYGGFSVHIWGAIKSNGTRSIIKCPQRLNSAGYENIITQGLLPMYEYEDIFQQDGATCHTSKMTIQFLENAGVNLLSDWPPQSPDVSIIENMWSILKRNVEKRMANTPETLWKIIVEEWALIPNSYISSLYDSIPRRLKLIIQNKGEHSKY